MLYNPETCGRDERGGRAEKAYYINGTQPTTYCTRHMVVNYCKESGAVANFYCPETTEKVLVLETERDFPSYVYIADRSYVYHPDPAKVCTIHTQFWQEETTDTEEITETDVITETDELTETEAPPNADDAPDDENNINPE